MRPQEEEEEEEEEEGEEEEVKKGDEVIMPSGEKGVVEHVTPPPLAGSVLVTVTYGHMGQKLFTPEQLKPASPNNEEEE